MQPAYPSELPKKTRKPGSTSLIPGPDDITVVTGNAVMTHYDITAQWEPASAVIQEPGSVVIWSVLGAVAALGVARLKHRPTASS